MKPSFLLLSALLAFPAIAHAGIDPANFDTSVKPQDDFYHYANGTWLKTHPIPPAYSAWGAFYEIDERNHNDLHTILERVSKQENRDKTTALTDIEDRVGAFYASGMDEAAVDQAGITPLKPELDRLAAIQTETDVKSALIHLHKIGVNVAFSLASEQDAKNSTMMIAGASQGGLGLPDRDYYTRDDAKSKELRTQYVTHVAKMLELAGDSPADAANESQAIMKLETALAKASKTNVDLRDPVANFHKLPLAEVQKLTPDFDWTAYAAGIGLVHDEVIDIGQTEFFQAFNGMLATTTPADWKAYFRWQFIHASAPFLSAPFVNENFAFFGKTLTGREELRERWKRVLDTVDGSVGEDLGQLYVAEFFPPESKARMLKMIGNLRAELRNRIEHVDWMDEPTRTKALAKLDAFGVKVGYPDKWIDYSKLHIDRGSYVLNVQRAREFNVKRDLNKVGLPKDRTEFGMTPPTVNAYYDPTMNEIVFPAGILREPFFDAKADDAVNYGGIGAIIGHEMTHGFDDQGRQFDLHGNLTDWWTPESAAKFKEHAAAIVKQFNSYFPFPDLHINGELTQGENIADLGGVNISYWALHKDLEGQPKTKIGGFTPEQRFFLSFATIWRENQRPEEMRLQINTDPHSPTQYRANGPLSNLPEFAKAFNIPEGSPMRRAPADRVVIW